ncbi:MAG: hypothetical protein ACTSU5_04050 [Promethearchaeota archaeon]
MTFDPENLEEIKSKRVALLYVAAGLVVFLVPVAFWVRLGFDTDYLVPLIVGPVLLLWGGANLVFIVQKERVRRKIRRGA